MQSIFISVVLAPFRRNGDLYRVGTYHLIKEIEKLEDAIPSIMVQVDTILDIVRDDEMAADFEQVFTKLAKRVSDHMGRGGENEARRLCLAVKRQIDAMPDGYWKGHYKSEFKQRFAHILNDKKKAKLTDFEKEE